MINKITANFEGCKAFIDDVIVFGNTWEQHLERVRELFRRLRTAKLTVNLIKSNFGHAHVIYLGHVVGQGQHFDFYLSAATFPIQVYIDHNPLVFLSRMKNKNQRLLRWSLALQVYDLKITHIRGKDNIVADEKVMFIPKFHCEINPIERVWCHAKQYTRAHCDYSFQGLEQIMHTKIRMR